MGQFKRDFQATVADKVLEFFCAKIDLPDDRDAILSFDYVAEPQMDSMAVVEMIVFFEEEFGINFTNDDFESDNFQTIGGLIGIIDKRRDQKKHVQASR